MRTDHIHWRTLPPGESSVDDVRRLYDGLQRRGGLDGFDEDRLKKAYELVPDQCHVGIDGFDGYIVFTFAYTPKALMECPIIGNAIFVIGSDWKRWSRMSKQELRADQSGEVARISHRGDWFRRVKQELDSQ